MLPLHQNLLGLINIINLFKEYTFCVNLLYHMFLSFFIDVYYQIEKVMFLSGEKFDQEWVLDFFQIFSPCIYRVDHMAFLLYSLNVVNYTDWFSNIKLSLHYLW